MLQTKHCKAIAEEIVAYKKEVLSGHCSLTYANNISEIIYQLLSHFNPFLVLGLDKTVVRMFISSTLISNKIEYS